MRIATLLFTVVVNSPGRFPLEVQGFCFSVDRLRIISGMERVLELVRF